MLAHAGASARTAANLSGGGVANATAGEALVTDAACGARLCYQGVRQLERSERHRVRADEATITKTAAMSFIVVSRVCEFSCDVAPP